MHTPHFSFDLGPATAAYAKSGCDPKAFLSDVALPPNRTCLGCDNACGDRLQRVGGVFGCRATGQGLVGRALCQRLTHQRGAWQNEAALKYFVWAEGVDRCSGAKGRQHERRLRVLKMTR